MSMAAKVLVTKMNIKDSVDRLLKATLGSCDKASVHAGLVFVDILMNEMAMNSHAMGYFNYTITLVEFIRQVIDQIFNASFDVMWSLLVGVKSDANEIDIRLLELGIRAIYSLICFPFESSYISFNTDEDLSDIGITKVPFEWGNKLSSIEFLQSMQALSCSTGLPEDSMLRFEAIRLISKLTSCKMDQILTSIDPSPAIPFLMLYSTSVTSLYDHLGKIPSIEVTDQLIDQIGRLFKLYRVVKICKFKDEFMIMIKTLAQLSKVVYLSSPDLDNKTFQSVSNLWSLVVDQANHFEFSVNDYLETTYMHFVEVYLMPDTCINFKLDVPDSVDSENFDKMVHNRFKALKDIFGARRVNLLQMLEQAIRALVSDTKVDFL